MYGVYAPNEILWDLLLRENKILSLSFSSSLLMTTSREPGDARGNSGFPELLGTSLVGLRPIGGPLRGPAQPFGLILHKMATLNCGSGNPEPQLSPCGQFEARSALRADSAQSGNPEVWKWQP